MNLGLIMSAWFGTDLDGRPGMERAREMGFDTIDLFWDPLDHDEAAYARLLQDVADVGLPTPSVICPAFGISDFNRSVRRFHADRACRHVDLVADVRGQNVLFVPGEYVFQGGILPSEYEWSLAVEGTRAVGEHARERGVELSVEMMPFPYSMVRDVDTMIRFLDDVGLDGVKACIDCSHLWLVRDDPSSLERLRGRINQVHISDCDGERHGDLPPGRGNTPLLQILEVLRDLGYDGTVSIELEFSPNPPAWWPGSTRPTLPRPTSCAVPGCATAADRRPPR